MSHNVRICLTLHHIKIYILVIFLFILLLGQATRIYEHCIAPRIILFTDGRVTRDSQMDELDSEYAPKDPQVIPLPQTPHRVFFCLLVTR